jgi:hypothetical protein
MSNEEAMALPLKDRPLNHRISSEMYHATFEAIGEASMCWNPRPSDEVFASEQASDVAVRLCFKIANEIEAVTKERDEARVALAAASGIFDQITQSLTKERDEAMAALDASNEARATVGERWLALDAALREIKRCPGRSCQTDRIASIALEKHGQRVIEIPPGGGGGFLPLNPSPEQPRLGSNV